MTIFNNVLSNKSSPSFSPMLDGGLYNCFLLWNLSAQRYYLSCVDLSGNQIFLVPLVESPPGIRISSLTWDSGKQVVNGVCSLAHQIPIGNVCNRTVLGCQPDSYNGTYMVQSTGATTFSYDMSINPNGKNINSAEISGTLNAILSMSAGYFNSTIIYVNGQFIIYP